MGDDGAAALARVEAELAKRWPESRIDPTLDRMRALVELLDQPQSRYPVIHVTGTNGKTSTARLIESLLIAFGLRTGRFTSPHVESVTERIVLDGQPLSRERFAAAFDEVAPYLDVVDAQSDVPLSFFEVLVAMAYSAFADAPVGAAVVEVGLGGEWDATNVADGQVAVVTPIAVDHAAYLGNDAATIAAEKAGIIKPGAVAVLAQQDVEPAEVLIRRAAEVGATVAREGLEFGVLHREVAVGGQHLSLRGLGGDYDEIYLPLFGAHQAQNAACALAAVEAFLGGRDLDHDVVREGFARATSPGRLEVVRTSPTIVLDAAHNPAGAEATAAAIAEGFSFSRLVGVVAVMADKDVIGILDAFEPLLSEIVVTQNSSHRCMPAHELGEIAEEVFGPDRVYVVPSLPDALETAVALAESSGELPGAGVLVTGSIVTVGDARWLLRRTEREAR
jgi:dihydrofolate synthase / folylpolyglutamate synthase